MTASFVCPTCGPNVKADEDGCCAMCGEDCAVAFTHPDVATFIAAAKVAIPEAEHPAEESVENWAWQIRVLGSDRTAAYRQLEQARSEARRLRGHVETIGLFIEKLRRGEPAATLAELANHCEAALR